MSHVVLGLDVGPNSIGWALVDDQEHRVIDLGVRVFPEGVDNFDTKKEKSRNEDRRIARGMRRQVSRRVRRKTYLRDALISAGFFPSDNSEQQALFALDPYALRDRAVDLQQALTPYELGRVFLHLNQRRGFLSNRKKDRGDSDVRGMLHEISELAKKMGDRTLGQYLCAKLESLDHVRRTEDDHVRDRHTRRDMLEAEFDLIWQIQARHHPSLLTEQLRYGRMGKQRFPCRPKAKCPGESNLVAFGIHGLIFFQRTMFWPKSVVGLCELEPKEKRCPRADRRAERFRLLQELNNLRYIDPDFHQECHLSEDHRAVLKSKLAVREKATFDQIRKWLGFLESVKFNLERGSRSYLQGLTSDVLMAKAVGKEWHKRPEDEKTAIVKRLLDNQNDDEAVSDWLVAKHDFTIQQAHHALEVDFKPGYAELSRKALDKLLPHMERGLLYMADDETNSALHAAGYLRRDQLQRRLFDRLPDPRRTRDCPIGDIPNPVVKRALVELRKVVNAIIREYGKPDAVHVEMARSVRMGKKARDEYSRAIREREEQRANAAARIREISGVRVNRDSILRYLLWEEQSHECVYCAKPISQQQLFGGEVHIDHVLPHSRCLDDSQSNKVVCHRQCNHDKRNRHPYEWLAESDPDRYDRLVQHAGSLMRKGLMPYTKYRRFLQKELDLDKFIARQLNDTGYIARATAEYLRCLFDQPHNVLGLKGQHTAELRWQWGLNSVLRHDDEDRKNREDHRHHAVDAVIIALTDRGRLRELTRIQKSEGFDPDTGEIYQLPEPWKRFREEVAERVSRIHVSHRPQRRVSGALHEDTLYGLTPEPGLFVVRKPIESLSPNEVPSIRDQEIRRIVEGRLAEHGIEVGRGIKVDTRLWKQALTNVENPLTMRSGVPIKKVRILRKEQTIQAIRSRDGAAVYVKPGANHHVCLFEVTTGGRSRIEAEYVTRLEAQRRIQKREPLFRKEHATFDNAEFVMSLCPGDMVLVSVDGDDRLMVVKTLVSTQKRIHLVDARDARPAAKKKDVATTPGTLIEKYRARKVTVDPLGRIRWAND